MNTAYQELKQMFGDKLKEHEVLSAYTAYKVGGPADLFFDARTRSEFERIVIESKKRNILTFILGGGTNILVSDTGFSGLVIRNSTSHIAILGMKGKVVSGKKKETVYVETDAGTPINKLVRFTLEEGLEGLEMHLGLPGSVGGAVFMNSKWTKPPGAVGDVVYQAKVVNQKGEEIFVEREYFQFSYGYSSLQKTHDILISVMFALNRGNKQALWERANESISYRRETQPQGVSTAGCVFKNISKSESIVSRVPNTETSAGYLLDQAGLKSLRIGKAEISPVHANFVLTSPGATACDVVQLISTAKKRVKDMFSVELKEEIEFVGDFSNC